MLCFLYFYFCEVKQDALKLDCFYNLENRDLEIGISGMYLHLLDNLSRIDVQARLTHFTR